MLEKAAMPYNPPAASLNRLATIVQKIAQAKPISKDFTKPPKILAKLPGGEIYFDSALELDTDGWPTARGKAIPRGSRKRV